MHQRGFARFGRADHRVETTALHYSNSSNILRAAAVSASCFELPSAVASPTPFMDTLTLKRGLCCGPDLPVHSYSGGLRRCAAAHSCSAALRCFGAGCWLSPRFAHAVRTKT